MPLGLMTGHLWRYSRLQICATSLRRIRQLPPREVVYSDMKIATIIARSFLGLIFVVFGSNVFLHFIPMPPPPEGPARDFTTALFLSHYLYVIGALQVA